MTTEHTDQDQLLTVEETAALLKVSTETLKEWRLAGEGEGPKFMRLGHRTMRYRRSDIAKWMDERAVT
jgi:excisionase family DNA binding protein